MKTIKVLVLLSIFAVGCDGNYTPKPMAYPRVEFPEKVYKHFSNPNCPFTFEIPTYAQMQLDSDANSEPCWYNLFFKPYNATLHISYKPVRSLAYFDSMYEDTRVLTMKHFERADQIAEYDIHNPASNVSGVIYSLKGNTATNYNFFITDSAQHFLRGALYFNTKTKQDSVLPAYKYMVQDIERLIESARWVK